MEASGQAVAGEGGHGLDKVPQSSCAGCALPAVTYLLPQCLRSQLGVCKVGQHIIYLPPWLLLSVSISLPSAGSPCTNIDSASFVSSFPFPCHSNPSCPGSALIIQTSLVHLGSITHVAREKKRGRESGIWIEGAK